MVELYKSIGLKLKYILTLLMKVEKCKVYINDEKIVLYAVKGLLIRTRISIFY